MTGLECPNCDSICDSWQKLRMHHQSAHGRSLPNRTCDLCGDAFYSEYEKKYCSEDCLDESDAYTGENNPNYSDARECAACTYCGDEFEYYPSEKRGLYCPECVANETWRDPPSLDGSNNPRWAGGKETFECDRCDETFQRYPGNTSEATLCSDECRADWLSEQFAGDGHPNWKGGSVDSYGPGWNNVRRQALERDGYACAVCGTDRTEIGRNPDVHHITPVRVFAGSDARDVSDAHYLANVVTLCPTCHRAADSGMIPKERLRELAVSSDPTEP